MMNNQVRVLLAEDDNLDAILVERTLRKANTSIATRRITSPRDVAEAVREFRPDLVLSDFYLEGGTAIDVLKVLRQEGSEAPAIIVTTAQSDDVAAQCFKEGAVDYVTKNALWRLPTAVLGALDKRNADREREQYIEAYRNLVEHSIQGLLILQDGKIVFVNQALATSLGYTIEELLAIELERAIDIVFEEDRELVRQRLQDHLSGKPVDSQSPVRFVRKNGEVRWFQYGATTVTYRGEPAIQGTFLDVTDRKLADLALEKSEKRFRALIEKSSDAICLLNLDGKISYISPIGARMAGYEPQERVGAGAFELIHPEEVGEIKARFEAVAAVPGGVDEVQFRLQHRNGSWRWVEAVITNMLHEEGVHALVVNFRDVTERKKREVELQLSEERSRWLSQTTSDGVWDWKMSSDESWWSDGLFRLFGYDKETVAPSHQAWIDRIHPDDRFRVEDNFRKLSEGNENVWRDQYRYIRCDGTVHYAIDRGVLLRDENAKPIRMSGAMTDVTSAKEAEIALRESEELHRALFESSPIPTWMFDVESLRFLRVNEAMLALYGYTHDEMMSMTVLEIRPPEEIPQFLERLATIGPGRQDLGVWRHKKKDGSLIKVEISTHTLTLNGRLRRVVQARDVTEKIRAEQALRASENEMRALFAAMRDVILRIDRDGRCLKIAPTNPDFPNRPPDELVGMYLHDIFESRQANIFLAHIHRSLRTKKTVHYDYSLVVNNREVWFDATVTPIDNDTLLWVARDVTDRKKAEAALKESQATYQLLFEANPHPMWVFDTKTLRFLAVNETATVRYGYSRDEFLSMTIEDIRPPEDLDKLRTHLVDTLKRSFDTGVWRHRKKDGSTIVVEISAHQIDFFGTPARLVLANEVTEKVAAEEKLKASEKRFRALIENGTDLIGLYDVNGTVIDTSPSVAAILGYTMEEYIGRNAFDLLHPDDLQNAQEAFGSLLRSPESSILRELRLKHKDGTYRWMEVQGSNLLSDPNVRAIVSNSRDVTERKEAQEGIRRSNQWFEAIFNASRDGMIVEDGERIWYANKSFAALFGYAGPEELKDRHPSVVLQPDEARRMDEYGRRRLRGESAPTLYEFKGTKKDGALIDCETSTSAIVIGGKLFVISTVRDIGERKKLEEQLRQSQKLESIGTLAGGIAHDMNNVLAIIMAYTHTLKDFSANPQSLQKGVDAIDKALQRGVGLVRQLLTFARKTEVHVTKIDVNKEIEELATLLSETFPKTIELTSVLDPKPVFVKADQSQLHQCLLNLCVNARDAMVDKRREGVLGGVLTIRTETFDGEEMRRRFEDAVSDRYVHISVSDTGIGMDDLTRARIFEPFFTTKGIGQGTGLGLSVVYGIVKGHNGFIEVESTKGIGTTFHLYFPKYLEMNTEEPLAPDATAGSTAGTETILLVEDEEMLRDLLCQALMGNGYRIIPAGDGDEAVRLFYRHKDEIDLVLTDLGLPKIGGWEAAKRMRVANGNLKIIFASGYIEPDVRAEMSSEGLVRFVAKPYALNEVMLKVREALDRP